MERDMRREARWVPAARQHAGRATWKGCILAAVKALNLVDADEESERRAPQTCLSDARRTRTKHALV